MRPAGRIVMFVHDPTGAGELLPDPRTLALLTAQTPVVWPDRKGPGRTLIYEINHAQLAAGTLRLAS